MLPLSIGDCSRNSVQARASHLRDAQERADAQRSGGLRQCTGTRVYGVETGMTWPNGQPRREWFCEASYSDGSIDRWGPGGTML